VEKVGRGVTEGSIPAFSWKKKKTNPSQKETKVRIAALNSDIFYCFLLQNMAACICETLRCAYFFHKK